ncbi:hypothetical protein WJX84_002773 [Apatococcus fuscideae]|uniref:Histone deacetylase complex subunit SAP30 Sin3 binding domain-containing protein n=1 Tax=Apatococcus fuscideae TaxID=2026836 RepID=A0AAW1TGS4_9CHLO
MPRTLPRRAPVANGASYQPSSEEDEVEAPEPVIQRASTRRGSKVDFYKLETTSLKKYRRVHKLGDIASSSKDELIPAIQRHFAAMVADEEETLLAFMSAVQKSGPMPRPPPVQIVRPKPKGKQKR